jgi:hypothetical protein
MLDELLRRVSSHTPNTLESGRGFPEAAVLLPITRSEQPELILTLRASGLSTHGGEVAFPGGRRDPEDPDLVFTALREPKKKSGCRQGWWKLSVRSARSFPSTGSWSRRMSG